MKYIKGVLWIFQISLSMFKLLINVISLRKQSESIEIGLEFLRVTPGGNVVDHLNRVGKVSDLKFGWAMDEL